MKTIINENIKSKISKAIYLASVLVMIFFFIRMVAGVFETTAWAFGVKEYSQKEMILDNQIMWNLHQTMLMSSVFIPFIAIFFKRIKIYMIAGLLLVCDWLPIYHWVEFKIPPFLDSLNLLEFLKREGQQMVNPQWVNVFLLIIGLSILLVLIIRKKTRSIDRIFTWFIATSAFVTLFVFHTVIVWGNYKFQKENQIETMQRQVLNESQSNFCKDRICFIFEKDVIKGWNKISENNEYENSYLERYPNFKSVMENRYSVANVSAYGKDFDNVFTYNFTNPENIGFDFFTMAIKPIENNKYVMVIENKNGNISALNIIGFSFLASIAHTIWIIGGFGILFFHKDYLFKRKIKAQQKNEEQKLLETTLTKT